ncbi:MAG: cupin domain-containing protein [Planctomycetes bacterium]|nr:cupin domain-containing protein [Planctomycetota bacterium]
MKDSMDTTQPRDGGSEGDWSDWAALYVLGALTQAERSLCERRLETDSNFRAEVERLRPTVDALHQAVVPVAPPAGLYQRVRERAGLEPVEAASIQPWKQWRGDSAPESFRYLASADGGFAPTAVPGIAVRKLHVDEAGDRVTMLVKMAPGTSYPRHRHAGPEECYVLAGDLSVGSNLHMRAGDFQRAETDSVHELQSTVQGCLLLITSSLRDELVA